MLFESIARSLCFPIPLYSGLVKILSLYLPNCWHSLYSLSLSTLLFFATSNIVTSWLAVCVLHFDSPQPTTDCLLATPSVGSSSSWDRPVYSAATFTATVLSWFKLALKESDSKRNTTRAGANGSSCRGFMLQLKLDGWLVSKS